MHSHERTLLASLGFQDRDKKNPLHDLACRFLAEPEHARRLVPLMDDGDFDPKFVGEVWESSGRVTYSVTEIRLGSVSARIEEAISKGYDRFKSTIGFVDVAISYTYEGHRVVTSGRESAPGDSWGPYNRGRLLGEVKTEPVPVSEVVRQINLYREYTSLDSAADSSIRWFLAVPFALSERDVSTLKREGIRAVRLGEGFRRWVEETKTNGAAEMPEF